MGVWNFLMDFRNVWGAGSLVANYGYGCVSV